MDMMQAAEAAQQIGQQVTDAGFDWHEVAVGMGALLVGICGWVWISTVGWLKKISEEFHTHITDDNRAFGEVKKMIMDAQIEVIRAVSRGHRED